MRVVQRGGDPIALPIRQSPEQGVVVDIGFASNCLGSLCGWSIDLFLEWRCMWHKMS